MYYIIHESHLRTVTNQLFKGTVGESSCALIFDAFGTIIASPPSLPRISTPYLIAIMHPSDFCVSLCYYDCVGGNCIVENIHEQKKKLQTF